MDILTTNNLMIVIFISLFLIIGLLIWSIFFKQKNDKIVNQFQPNFYSALRDIMVAAMSKGQLPLAGLFIILIIGVVKMSGTEAYALLLELITTFKNWATLGWLLFIFTIFMSSIIVRNAKKNLDKELAHKVKECQLLLDKISILNQEIDLLKQRKPFKK